MSKHNKEFKKKVHQNNGQKEDKSEYIYQRDKIKDELTIRNFPWTPRQLALIDLILDKETKLVFIKGPAGVSKTLTGVYCGLRLLKDKKCAEFLYIRSIIESASKSMGSLPGESDLKMRPFMAPLEDKLNELLPPSQVKMLINDERVKANVINYLRGSSLQCCYILGDEIQNFTFSEITTLITRLGKHSKMIVCADPNQSDINGKSGFMTIYNIFNNEESRQNGIYTFEFTKEDIMRSGVCKYIVEKLEDYKNKNSLDEEPMFK